MLSKHIFNLIASFFLLLLIVVSCANPVTPTGGPKDETPPEFLGSDPVNRARNFASEKIDLVFDEFVVLSELNQQLLVSPPMQNKLDIKTKGKGVRIKFDKEELLADSTTYTVYFGNAIVDLHEGNPFPNFQYVFSTGPDIDSLSIRGKVLSAKHLLPIAGVTVCLYLDNSDTLSLDEMPQKIRPYYVAKTNEEGSFEINNIRNDSYLIFAVSDANANYFNDMPNEAIAFADKMILPEEVFDFIPDTIPIDTSNVELMDSLWANYAIKVTKQTHTLLLYEPQDSVQRVIKKELVDNNRMRFEFKFPLKEAVKFNVLDSDTISENIVFLEEYSSNMDSLDIWFLKPFADTNNLILIVDTLKADTIEILLNEPEVKVLPSSGRNRGRSRQESKNLTEPKIAYSSNVKAEFPYFSKVRIVFETPIKTANFENCSLMEDTVSVPFEIRFTDKIKRKLLIDYPWKEGVNYRFEIPDQALTDIYGTKNDSMIAKFKTTEESNYGELQIHFTLPNESNSIWQVQLIKGDGDKEQILSFATVKDSSNVLFSNLSADKYRIKILEDRDSNGRWSSGNYVKKRLPEKVFYFPTVIEIQAGWKVEEEWEINYEVQENTSVIKAIK
ncbi:MAG: Ig-like domain-containing protein [Bacteroidales bacterium]|nr:Ig-like domain-containing protein [Bacteroidales bacterium]